jgi:hypothetical protein
LYKEYLPFDSNAEFVHGRHVEHDERSLNFVRKPYLLELTKAKLLKQSILWPRFSKILDQGQLGSCTGNAFTGWLGCAPYSSDSALAARFDEQFAINVYSMATAIDGFPGEYPPDDTGSSGLAVAKVGKNLGLISKYSWATTTNGLIAALYKSPVIVGVPWYTGFYTPGSNDGVVRITGKIEGGHEFLIRGYNPKTQLFTADNSWGANWGLGGSFKFSVATWEALRRQKADVTIPIK